MVMTLVSLQATIITYTVCGFILKKAGWITGEGQSFLSDLILDFMTSAIVTLLLGMPAGSRAAVFAEKYKGDTVFASMTVMITTVLSTVTLVMLLKLTEMVIGI